MASVIQILKALDTQDHELLRRVAECERKIDSLLEWSGVSMSEEAVEEPSFDLPKTSEKIRYVR